MRRSVRGTITCIFKGVKTLLGMIIRVLSRCSGGTVIWARIQAIAYLLINMLVVSASLSSDAALAFGYLCLIVQEHEFDAFSWPSSGSKITPSR